MGADLKDELDLAEQEEASGRLTEAHARLTAMRGRLGSPVPTIEMHIAWLQDRMGDRAAALATMQQVVHRNPRLATAHTNLAALLAAQGAMREARDVLRRAAAAMPDDAALSIRLASIETYFGDRKAALGALENAAKCIPTTAELWRWLGHGYAEHWQYELADRALNIASALDPGVAETETQRAFVRSELGDVQGALDAIGLAVRRHPNSLPVALFHHLALPQVYADRAELTHWRKRYEHGLGELEARIDDWLPDAAGVFSINGTNFLLAYQGEDDKDLQRRYSSLLSRLACKARPEWCRPRERTFDGSRKLRVGFAGTLFRDSTPGRYFRHWITGLDRRFERFVYYTGSTQDAMTEEIRKTAEHFRVSRGGVVELAPLIIEDELDVLVLPEVGMDPAIALLCTLRLAPVQLAGWGHPVTTGSSAIDGFLSCESMELPDAQRHYVEPLVRLPGLGVRYSMPAPVPAIDRRQFGVTEQQHLYICAQALFKVHPDMDDVFADILAQDPQGLLLLFQGASRHVTDRLAARLQAALERRGLKPTGQIKFLPRVDSATFRAVLGAADVVLDTVRWSGGNTSLDAFSAAVPVVTLPGELMRARQTGGMLAMMGLPELIAQDAAGYVDLAVSLARDRSRNVALRRAIAERRAALFDRNEPIDALCESLLRLAS